MELSGRGATNMRVPLLAGKRSRDRYGQVPRRATDSAPGETAESVVTSDDPPRPVIVQGDADGDGSIP